MKTRILVLGAGFGGLELSTSLSEALGDATARLLADPATAKAMGENGAGFVVREFRWERGAGTLWHLACTIAALLSLDRRAR